MEGGEWSSFNGVYVNEEADFMAQLFPTNTSLTANNVADGGSGMACWSNTFNMATGAVYASSDATANSNLYCSFSQESCYSGGNGIVEYPTAGQENFYVCDNSHQFLAPNNSNGALVEFRDDIVGGEDCIHERMEESGEVEHGDSKNFLPKRGSEMSLELEDKISDSSEIPRKRARASDVPKGKRNANKSRKKHKASVVDEDDNAGLTRPSSSTCSSEDESNLSLQLNNGGSSSSSALNLNGKTRASRGSATDPQSLYARKRRERINERLKILQKLVPNGTKVDISTMLEEAVLYVKFLQLQIKLLSSDDTWMYAPIAYNGMDIGLDLNINAQRS